MNDLSDGIYSWRGAAMRIATAVPGLLEEVSFYTGLDFQRHAHAAGLSDLVVARERVMHIHAADRCEQKEFATPANLRAWLVLTVSDLLSVRARLTLVHAASVVVRERAVLLCGEPCSGKSTLALTAHAAGLPVIGDDLVWIDPSSGAAHPCPRPIKMRLPLEQQSWAVASSTASLCANLDGEEILLHPRRAEKMVAMDISHPVGAVAHLRRHPGPGVSVTSLDGPGRLRHLLAQVRSHASAPLPAALAVAKALLGVPHVILSVGDGETGGALGSLWRLWS